METKEIITFPTDYLSKRFDDNTTNQLNIIQKVKLSELSENQIIKEITKDLYNKNSVRTSKSKIKTTEKFTSFGVVNKGEEYEIIGCDYNFKTKFILVNKSAHDKTMSEEGNNELKLLYTQIRNGWENCENKEVCHETIKTILIDEIIKAFDYILIEKEKQENENEDNQQLGNA